MSDLGDINALWKQIKSSENLDTNLLEQIQKTVLEESVPDKAVSKPSTKRSRKNLVEKPQSARIFGNPMRNVSDNLMKLYKEIPEHREVLLPFFEKMSYSKKLEKFTKWPILLKDFIHNLHQEYALDISSSGKIVSEKEELLETPKSSKINSSKNEDNSKDYHADKHCTPIKQTFDLK